MTTCREQGRNCDEEAIGSHAKGEFVEWVGSGFLRSRNRWGDFTYTQEVGGGGSRTVKSRLFTREGGTWPTDDELIALADGDPPAHPRHFGGDVTVPRGEGQRLVHVHTD